LWVALGLALVHAALTPLSPAEAAPALGLPWAVLSCLVLPLAGLPAALLLLASRGRRELGAFSLLALSLGLALVVHFVTAVVTRALGYLLDGLQLSLVTLALVAAGRLLGRRFGGVRVRPEPGLYGPALALALVVALAVAVVGRHRLFGGLQRLLIVPHDVVPKINESFWRLTPDLARLSFIRGVQKIGPDRYRFTGQTAYFKLIRQTPEPRTVRLAFVLNAPSHHALALFAVPTSRCGLGPRRGGDRERLIAVARIPRRHFSVEIPDVTPRFNALLIEGVELKQRQSCFGLRLRGPPPLRSDQAWFVDISHADLSDWIVDRGRITMIGVGEAECHLSDAHYRWQMRRSNAIEPKLLLWGYFTQLAAAVLAGGDFPALGVLFLCLALLCFAAALVMIGVIAGEQIAATRRGKLAALLLVGPFAAHVVNMVFLVNQYFAYPDAPYTALLVASLTLLLLRQRAGFILLGCLAAYARYPGAYVLAVMLLAWLVLKRDDRRWTLRTLLWSLAAGLVVIGALLLHFHSTIGLHQFYQAVYFEIFPEHFEVSEKVASPAVRIPFFFLKLAVLSCFTMLLWPLGLRRGQPAAGKLLVTVTLGYAVTLMSVQVAHDHYFQFLIYTTAAAGLGALARSRSRWLAPAVVVLVVLGALLSFFVSDWMATIVGIDDLGDPSEL
jgi:hypothetical protein